MATHDCSPSAGSAPTATAPPAVVLTEQVYALRRRTRRRVFPPSAYVYPTTPDGHLCAVEPADLLGGIGAGELDHALRVDLLLGALERLIGGTGRLLLDGCFDPDGADPGGAGAEPGRARACSVAVVVIRAGPVEPLDEERAWWRALVVAGGVLGIESATVYAITRRGWLDVNDGHPVLVPRRRLPGSGSQCPSRSRYSEEVRRKVS